MKMQSDNTEKRESRQQKYPVKSYHRTGKFAPDLNEFFRNTEREVRLRPEGTFVIIHWDIDSFKVFNNIYSTDAGNLLLQQIGKRCELLKKKEKAVLSYGYMGADHFLFCWEKTDFDPERIWQIISDLVQESFPEFVFSVKCGLREINSSDDIPAACEQALLALRSIKGRYDENYVWYDASMLESRLKENEITATMKKALNRGDFVPYFQPQYNHLTGEIIGMEALARWNHPQKGLLSPADFIPVFEKTGFIFEMDKCIWRKSCECMRRWIDGGLQPPPLSVNVSRKSLYHPLFIPSLKEVVEQNRIAPHMLNLEITESAYMENKEQLLGIISRLHDLGFKVEMDDFGSGFSSLNFLKDVPVDLIKLDTEFLSMKNVNRGKGGNILSSIIRLAHGINLDIIAEGVEDKNQADLLKSLGCLDMQGYYFAKPMDEDHLTQLLKTGKIAGKQVAPLDTGIDRAVDFLDDTTQSALLFNSFVGGAAILEYRGDTAAILRMNDKFFDVLGVGVEEYRDQQMRVLESFTPETKKAYIHMLETAIATGEEAECESCSVNLCSKKEPLWIHNRVRFLARKVDSFLFYLSVENITQNKKLMEKNQQLISKLDEKMQLQEKMLDNIPAAVAHFRIVDGKMVCERLSRGAMDLLRFGDFDSSCENICQRMQTLTQQASSVLNELFEKASTVNPQPFSHDLCIRTEDGKEHWLNLSASPHLEVTGELCYFGIYTDITARKTSEQMLRLREAEYRSVVQQSRKVICRYHIREKCLSVREESANLLGLSSCVANAPETFIQLGCIIPESQEEWRRTFDNIHAGQESGKVDELGIRYQDGSIHWYAMQYTCVRVDSELMDTIILFFEDITEQRSHAQNKAFEYAAMFKALHRVYPMTMACNLTRDYFYIFENENYIHHNMGGNGASGSFDQLIQSDVKTLPENEQDLFRQTFCRQNLLKAFEAGQETVELEHHQYADDGTLHWVKTTVLRVDNPNDDDVLEITMAQVIDQQKASEEQLKEKLSAASDILAINEEEAEVRISLSEKGRIICRYDWNTNSLLLPKEYAELHHLPHTLTLPLSENEAARSSEIRHYLEGFQQLASAISNGEPSGVEELCFPTEDGREIWQKAAFVTLFNPQNKPVRTIVTLEDTTALHRQDAEINELRFSEHLMRLVAEHSGRTIYYLDLEKQNIVGLDSQLCESAGLPSGLSLKSLFLRRRILFASGEKVEAIVDKIKSGIPHGEMKAQIRGLDNQQRWFDIHFSTIWSSDGEIQGAVISLLDITQQHRQELTYERYRQSMSNKDDLGLFYLEADLTANIVEQVGGNLLDKKERKWLFRKKYTVVLDLLLKDLFTDQNRKDAENAFQRNHLMERFGEKIQTTSDWEVIFPKRKNKAWLRITVQMIKDKYTDHIHVFMDMRDVTEEKEAYLRVRQQAERDGLTGLYNRASIEWLVNQHLLQRKNETFAFILMDLDDLKTINDRYGHHIGDYVLQQLGQILSTHFGSSHFSARVGGDEFVIFMTNVLSEASVHASIQGMLDKILQINIGQKGEYQVHCSAGCCLSKSDEADFNMLYRNADLALYHIKRNGKNDYAMFTEEMHQHEFQFHGNKEVTLKDNRLFSSEELGSFLSMIAELYPMVLSMNLTQDRVYIMESKHYINSSMPMYGSLSDFMQTYRQMADQSEWKEVLNGDDTRQQLINAYRNGQHRFIFLDRQMDDEGQQRWVKTFVLLYQNSRNEICGFALLRPLDDDEKVDTLTR